MKNSLIDHRLKINNMENLFVTDEYLLFIIISILALVVIYLFIKNRKKNKLMLTLMSTIDEKEKKIEDQTKTIEIITLEQQYVSNLNKSLHEDIKALYKENKEMTVNNEVLQSKVNALKEVETKDVKTEELSEKSVSSPSRKPRIRKPKAE